MPRVKTRTKSTRGTKTYICSSCHERIDAGEVFYYWSRRFGGRSRGVTYYQHHKCGFPRPTQLSSRKTAQIEEALLDADFGSWQPEVPGDWSGDVADIDVDYSHLNDTLSSIAEVAREVASEYESGADSMPEALQYSPTAEAMREVAQELESWADDLEQWDAQSEPDWPEREETPDGEESLDDFRARVEDALQSWGDEIRSDAESQTEGMPEYNG